MDRISFFSVLASNIKCACCKKKNCPVRYTPERKNVQYSYGTRFVIRCEKDMEKEFNKILKEKLP